MSEHQVDQTDDPAPPAPVLERHRSAARRAQAMTHDPTTGRVDPPLEDRIAQALADAEAAAYVRGYNAGHEVAEEQAAERGKAGRKAVQQVARIRVLIRTLEGQADALDIEAVKMHGQPPPMTTDAAGARVPDFGEFARKQSGLHSRAEQLRAQASAMRHCLTPRGQG